jgi:chemotaxis methyl-accepting protein methylase
MNEVVSQAACFRHVVFPDSIGGYGRALNVTPHHPPAAEGAPRPPTEPSARSLSPETESLFRWLFSQAGVDFRHYKPETLSRRLPACLRALRASSAEQVRAVLRRNPELIGVALDATLIGVTSFFRDEGVFTALRRRVLPDLVGRWRAAGGVRPLRVWSAGCSNGAELYSVALLLLELGALWPGQCELLGTDCRPEALAGAAAGVFEPATLKQVPPALLRQYFVCAGDHYRVRADIRSAVRWRRGDVLAAPEPGPWDLVLCRNLSIYLQPEASALLWSNLVGPLRPGGVLVPGKAERPLGVRGLASVGPCVYRKEGA